MRRLRSALVMALLSACAGRARTPEAANTPGYPAGDSEQPDFATAREAPNEDALASTFDDAPALATLRGQASYYGDSLAGHRTASGEPYRPREFTAAHRLLPLGTILRVTRGDGTRTVYVRVNDRGPYGSQRRILDLSRAAAAELGMLRAGVLDVRAEVVAYGKRRRH